MRGVALLFLCELCTVTSTLHYGVYEHTQLLEAGDLNSGATVTVESLIQGAIKWKNSDDKTLRINVTVTSEDARRLKDINITFLSDVNSVRLRIAPSQSVVTTRPQTPQHLLNAASLAKVAIWLNLMVAAVLVPMIGQGWQHGLVGPLLLSSIFYLVYCEEPIDIRVAITISSPRHLQYTDVRLFVQDGNITVDSDALIKKAPFSCSTSISGPHGCPSCCNGNGVCGLNNKCTCNEEHNNGDACAVQQEVIHSLFTNPGDSRMTQTTLPSGDIMDVYGKRRRDGSVRSINTVKVNGNRLSLAIDNKARIQSIRSSDGSIIHFDWKSKCDVYVTATTADKRQQVNVDVKLCKRRYTRSTDTTFTKSRGKNFKNRSTQHSKRKNSHADRSDDASIGLLHNKKTKKSLCKRPGSCDPMRNSIPGSGSVRRGKSNGRQQNHCPCCRVPCCAVRL